VSAIGRKLAGARLGGAPSTAGAGKPAPPPASGGGAPPSSATAPSAATAKPASSRPAASAGGTSAPSAASEPWNFDLPVRELPADYPSDASEPAAEAPTAAPAVPAASTKARRAKPTPEPTLAYESPIPPVEPGVVDTRPIAAAVAPAASAAATAAEAVASAPPPPGDARSRAVALIERALRAGAHDPSLPPASKPQEFGGPDGELLRVQDEALALALEALRRPQ
jgi:hypothetical protein